MNEYYRFVNTPLPYPYSAMEPYIDEKTMWLHHSRHLQAYIDNLNNTLSKYPALRNWTLEELIMNTASLPEDIRTAVAHNSGGVFNHQFYFSNLANPAQQQPFGTLNEAIRNRFRNYASFQAQFKEAALSVFGSGYAWLVVNAFGELDIMTTGNQDTPLPLEIGRAHV